MFAMRTVSGLVACSLLAGLPARAASESVVYAFRGGSDGANPEAPLIDVGGALYGTTGHGGGSANCLDGCGTVVKVTQNGTETVLYAFQGGNDGAYPQSALINVDGALYGTTFLGGGSANCVIYGCGTVFKVTKDGVETVLHAFQGGSDGTYPLAGLINVDGTLYGTTKLGGGTGCGGYGCGTVFALNLKTGAETVVYAFKGGSDGANPASPLINVGGTLYGTTTAGSKSRKGTVFKVTTAGAETVLHAFQGAPDGASPQSPLINVGGALYGTTNRGGTKGRGTVFRMTMAGAESVLYSFKNRSDGGYPSSGLIEVGGTLYGTAGLGGTHANGMVFKITSDGAEKVVYSFKGGSDGSMPTGLIEVGGTLYGTTYVYGAGGGGTVFELTR